MIKTNIYMAPESEEVQLSSEQTFMGPSSGIGTESVSQSGSKDWDWEAAD